MSRLSLVDFSKLNIFNYCIKNIVSSSVIMVIAWLLYFYTTSYTPKSDDYLKVNIGIILFLLLLVIIRLFIPSLTYIYTLEYDNEYVYISYQKNLKSYSIKLLKEFTSFEIIPSGRSNPYLKIESELDGRKFKLKQYQIQEWDKKLFNVVMSKLESSKYKQGVSRL